LVELAQFLMAIAASASTTTINWTDNFYVVLMAIGVNLLYAFGRRHFTDMEKVRRINAEMKAFRSEYSAAVKEGNKQKIERLKRKQQQMTKMQMEQQKAQFKPTLLFMGPLLGGYYLMSLIVGGSILAISPIAIPLLIATIPNPLKFYWWYFICSFAFSGIISRLFGLTLD
jgi:uncharacterized membrane protein (DUF106 family)